jgi:uncharacterized protein (DUF2252 family)
MPTSLRAFDLARRQIELDRDATSRFPVLFARKRARMLASPHAFLRGAAPLFYEILASRPELAEGPAGEGFLVGDMHLENVGAYRNDDDVVVFDLNDFDDAAVGPWRLDVLRLCTSVLLAGRTFQATGSDAIALCGVLLDAYVGGACEARPAPPVPTVVRELIARASARTNRELLDQRAPLVKKGQRAFVRGERYLDLPSELAAQAPALLEAYVAALGDRAPGKASGWRVEDAAQRVAGTGSLGHVRLAMLVHVDADHDRVVELKEADASSVSRLVPQAGHASHAHRVVEAARALVKAPTRQLAPVIGAGTSFLGRKLRPEEDKLVLEAFRVGHKLSEIVGLVGHLLGHAHARAATARPAAPWSAADRAALVDHAIELAGLHEAAYLAYARLDVA